MNTFTENQNIQFVGIDFGNGESAVATVRLESKSQPTILDYRGEKSIITVVGIHPVFGIMIGREAINMADESTKLWRRFKGLNFESEDLRVPIEHFIKQLVGEFQQKKLIGAGTDTKFLVGCPSDWKPADRKRYKDFLHNLGLTNVEVTSESRAAFLSSRSNGDLGKTADKLGSTVLLIDMGSSTVDFTAVSKLQEQPIDFGDNNLGAGLIEEEILNYLVSRHKHAGHIRKAFSDHPSYEVKCELLCRTAKEKYFSMEETLRKNPTMNAPVGQLQEFDFDEGPVYFKPDVNTQVMQTILSSPIAKLNNLNWADAFRNKLQGVKDELFKEFKSAPDLIILTGGASRMEFAMESCRQIFPPPTNIIRGKEPEFAIATGLALAGRIDVNTKRFKSEIQNLLESKEIHKIVESEIDSLIHSFSDIIVAKLVDGFIMPAFEEWKAGRLKTLGNVTEQVNDKLIAWLEHGEGKTKLIEATRKWFRNISPKVEQLTKPICDKYEIDNSAFGLDDIEKVMEGQYIEKDPFKEIYDEIAVATTLVLSMVIGIVVTAMSVTVTFPIGFIIVTVVTLFAGAAVAGYAGEQLLRVNLPNRIRMLFLSAPVKWMIGNKESEIKSTIIEALSKPNPKTGYNPKPELVNNLIKPIKLILEKDAERAELLIR